MIDPLVEKDVMNRLQDRESGQTIEQLQEFLKVPRSKILAVLHLYQTEGHVVMSKTGTWTVVKLPT
jgi:hypothetical protein